MISRFLFTLLLALGFMQASAQQASLNGQVTHQGEGLPYAQIVLKGTPYGVVADSIGNFQLKNVPPGQYSLRISSLGYIAYNQNISLHKGENLLSPELELDPDMATEEVVITGTLKPVQRMESAVPVEVYNPTFFRKNPTPNVFEALQNINGVRPQLNCNVCNTGDIHINGLEGPYTMILLDGMPIVSGLSTVYGLSGIPNSMIERVEIVKGPASSLYGSEAVGGLINIITKTPNNAPIVSADFFGTSWQEANLDVGLRAKLGEKVSVLTGINGFLYDNPIDNNGDNFTDVTLQKRVSVFQKWNVQRKENRVMSLAARYYYEDRWGGEMNWTSEYRGGDEIYGESIYTERMEVLGAYQLPMREKVLLSFSFNSHDQNSVYGDMPYLGLQRISFGQMTWDKKVQNHDLLFGAALRHTFYDDNTTATSLESNNESINDPSRVWLPGVFIQDEITFSEPHKLLIGLRYDHHSAHGSIFTPRVAWKWKVNDQQIFRLNAGTGFRAVTLFTEDHAALTGAREVIIEEDLLPEQSYNINLNYMHKVFTSMGHFISFDVTAFYTYFTNQIVPDYDTDPNLILYANLEGYAVASGISANVDIALANGLKILVGATAMDNYLMEDGQRTIPVLNERFNGTWAVSYTFPKLRLSVDYTGNLYGPMRLPTLGELDPRAEFSPWWSLQNIQFTYASKKGNWEIYGGIKNLLDFTPPANSIARAFDPFDRQVAFDPDGNVLPTASNPYALTFDPSYVYAPNQGRRGFMGVRFVLR